MSRIAFPLVVLAICYAIFCGYVAYTYHDLPEKVASHFDIHGKPNGWMGRHACVEFSVGLAVFAPALIIGLMAGAGRNPMSFLNLPHRDFWMSPERRMVALDVLFRYAMWLASLIVLVVTGAHALIVRANRPEGEAHLSSTNLVIVLGAFLVGTTLWILSLVRKFSKLD